MGQGSIPGGFDQEENRLKVLCVKNVRKQIKNAGHKDGLKKDRENVVANTNLTAHPIGASPMAQLHIVHQYDRYLFN